MMSTNFPVLVGLSLLMCTQVALPALSQDFAAINARASTSVVEILVKGTKADGRNSVEPGSGFIVHVDAALPYAFVFTAAHVIGKDEEWLANNDGKPVDRKIAVRQQSGITMVPIDDNASIVGVDYDTDAAVLSIAKRPIDVIPAAGFDHLKQLDALLAIGFPANEGKQVPLIGPVRSIDYSRMRIEIDKVIRPGQSGGPIIDQRGWAVGIASENDNKLAPSYHRAAVVSAAVRLLNTYLVTVGRPPLSLKNVSSTNKLSISSRNGSAKVRIGGDSGALASSRPLKKVFGSTLCATLIQKLSL